MTMLLAVRNLKKEFGDKEILKDISFDISVNDKIGLVGLNGAGKSTIFNILSGELEKDGGMINFHKKNINVCYMKQDSISVKRINCVSDIKEYEKITRDIGIENKSILETSETGTLSGGEKTKKSLAEVFSIKPDLLLLDEPTNHLDYKGVQYIIDAIKSYKGTMIVISHDRYFLDQCVNRIIEVEDGICTNYSGNYSFYRKEKKRRYEDQLKAYTLQEETKRKINEQIEVLKGWSEKGHRESRRKAIASGNKFGGKEFLRAKAKKKDNAVKSRIKRLEKIKVEGIDKPKEERKVDFNVSQSLCGAKRIVEANNISKSFDGRILFKKSSFYVMRGERIGLFGDNGCGKSTLIKIMLGEQELDGGKIFFSSSVKLGYVSQSIDLDENDETTVLEMFDVKSNEEEGAIRRILFNMGFDDHMINQKVNTLSLGEITRLKIIKMINDECNVLILDEPLNHLDIHSREKLEEVLEGYDGTIILVSHDRYMMNSICDKLLVFKGKRVQRVEKKLDEYLKSSEKVNVKIDKEKLMILENDIACILGKLSLSEEGSEEYKELDKKFRYLIECKNNIMVKGR